MKAIALGGAAAATAISLAGCGYKDKGPSQQSNLANPPASRNSGQTNTQQPGLVPSQSLSSQPRQNESRLSEAQIRHDQLLLKKQGFYKGSINGKFSPQMRQAIAQFQKSRNMNPTGTLDDATRSTLNSPGSPMGAQAPNA